MTDSSGIKLYHTPNKRANSAAYAMRGTLTLNLPAGEENILEAGGCPSECNTNINPDTLYVSEIIPHMHYYGGYFILYSYIL